MITKISQIYQEVANKNSLDLDIVTSIGTTAFSTLLENLMKPHEISYELPKLGAFILKQDNFRNYYRQYMRFVNTGAIKNEVDINRVKGLKEKVDNFRQTKKEKREKRYEFHHNTNQSSQDKSEEHKIISSGLLEKVPNQVQTP